MKIQIANIVDATRAEGPGQRIAVWLQCCPLRCPGCCSPEMLSFKGGQAMEVEALLERIDQACHQDAIEGITWLGGEPFAHAEVAAAASAAIQSRGLSVMIFSGYTIEQLRGQKDAAVDRLLSVTDILVDGPYLKEQPDESRRWIGSSNQRIHFLSDRYRADDASWQQRDTLEIRLNNGELSVNGFPAKNAVGMWKRPRSR